MIDASFVQKVVDTAQAQQFQVEGKTFTTKQVFEVEPKKPEFPESISVFSLQGFAELIRQKIEELNPANYLIHIENETTVAFKSKYSDEHGRRLELIDASPVKFEGFKFGQWLNQEEFVIGVASRFSQTDDKDYILSIASSLTNEAVVVSEDNGFSQKATVRAGLALQEVKTIKPQVLLAPFRTFPEIGQPISSFVFRARSGEKQPSLMLVEADGGKWKLDAINEIRRYLSTLQAGDAVLGDIPIIA